MEEKDGHFQAKATSYLQGERPGTDPAPAPLREHSLANQEHVAADNPYQ